MTSSREGALRRRLLATFVALSLVPLFGSNAIGYLRSRLIVEGLAGRYLIGVADVQAAHGQDRLDQWLLRLQAVSVGNRFLQAAAERDMPNTTAIMREAAAPWAVSEYLTRKAVESGGFDDMVLFTPAGELLASSAGRGVANVWPEQGTRALTLVHGVGSAAPVLRLSAPVRNEADEVVAYLAATIPLARTVRFLRTPDEVADDIEVFLLDERGYPLVASHVETRIDYDRPLGNPLVGQPPGSLARYRDIEGVEVIGASATLSRQPWTLVAEVPTDDALGELAALRRLSLVLGGAFAVLVIVAGWLIAGSIVAPVRRLLTATRRVAAGDLDVTVSEAAKDEIGELTEAFNEMAAELRGKQARIEALHRQDIERAEQLATVGELATGVAHEIKNPVAAISNGLDLVLRRTDEDVSLQPIASEMRHQLGRIDRAVRDLLAFARPAQPSLASTDLSEVVRRAVALVTPTAVKRDITVDFESVVPLPPVMADPELMGQAVVNLLLNAIQFSEEGGHVGAITGRRGSDIFIEIRDTGPGIQAAVLDEIFKPFFTTRHSGTGLGLSITRGIVERHGGRIEVETAPGRGSAFVLLIPLGTGEEEG
jgi:signal transduction histidine kinase